MNRILITLLAVIMTPIVVVSCKGKTSGADNQSKTTEKAAVLGAFDADSAYRYVDEQVAFGPRVPGTAAHDSCAAYLIGKLKSFGADSMIVQNAVVEAFNGDRLPITNIFARYNIEAPNRVLLVAHWDTRPWANMERTEEKRNQPVPGANDGGSGVGVLLEIARNLGMKAPECGVDILFVDAEDYGDSNSFIDNNRTWCLGTQHWIENMPYNSVNRPAYGILLDMVGGTDARFHREHFSHMNARRPTVRVWSEAKALGFEDIFVNKVGGTVVDDHVFLNEAGIPTTDIIENLNDVTGDFPPTWHTLDDNMQHISRRSLDAVGKTVLNVVYKEPAI